VVLAASLTTIIGTADKLITFTCDTEDPFLRRALKTARELRAAKDAEAAAVYLVSTPKREPTY